MVVTMLAFHVIAITSILNTVFLNSVCEAQQQCGLGWFGDTCQFQCHCADGGACSQSDGTCSSGCHPGWFGPGCQYVASAYQVYGGSNPLLDWLIDNDDTTCNNENLPFISVTLDTPHILTWIRLVVNDADQLGEIRISYRTENSWSYSFCSDMRTARVDNTTVDATCATTERVNHVIIYSNVSDVLCSLYISGGRNVALKQNAVQSSSFSNWYAYRAVDGDPGIPDNLTSLSATCTHTGLYSRGWWRVTFANLVVINRIRIYNKREPSRSDCCEQRLVGFSLTARSRYGYSYGYYYNWGSSYNYTQPGGPPQDVYTVVPEISFSVHSMRIDVGTPNNNILTLCEVYVFGEVECSNGKFGRQCERDCNCRYPWSYSSCFVSTGGCPQGCAYGYTGEDCHTPCEEGTYGYDCAQTCSEHCAGPSHSCSQFNGSCYDGCMPGYYGSRCQYTCRRGRYGQDCLGWCHNCAGNSWNCSHVDGACAAGCRDGYQGLLCKDNCTSGTFGPDCSLTCSDHCAGKKTCDHITGTCNEGCEPGYRTAQCNLTYLCYTAPGSDPGSLCKYECHCVNDTACDMVTGACPSGCASGWFGPACQYVSLPFTTEEGVAELAWLSDEADETCNQESVQSVTVFVDIQQPLTWIRVVVNNTAWLDDIQIAYGGLDGNGTEQTYADDLRAKVDAMTLDIYCNTTRNVSQLTLSGRGVQYLCSLYISGGRNVALRQDTWQSSTYSFRGRGWKSSKAVDGHVTLLDHPSYTCSHTQRNTNYYNGQWKLTFLEPVMLLRIVIYNRQDCCKDRLKGFQIRAYKRWNWQIFRYTDSHSSGLNSYTIVPSPTLSEAVHYLRIYQGRNSLFLTLCEVFIFGEVACPDGKFGRECERHCNCAGNETCFVATGGCPFGCAPGYTGEDCYTPCTNGTYGLGCESSCSEHCGGEGLCDTITGTCTQGCEPGYQDDRCEDKCQPGTFGPNCAETCSEHCAGPDRACHHLTGSCDEGCDLGYHTAQCNVRLTPETACRQGWRYYQGACYGLGHEALSWSEAGHVCTLYGGFLAEIHSVEENNFIKSYLQSSSFIHDVDGVWIGGTDMFYEGSWEWAGSKEPISEFTDWGADEPNNSGTGGRENCLSMWAEHDWAWNDEHCRSSYTLYFVCEVVSSLPAGFTG